jgi:hypothetical protein
MNVLQQKPPQVINDRIELSDRYKRIYEEAVRRSLQDDAEGLEFRLGSKQASA